MTDINSLLERAGIEVEGVRLSRLLISEVSAVDRPANLTSGWMVSKSRERLFRIADGPDDPSPIFATESELRKQHAEIGAAMDVLQSQITLAELPPAARVAAIKAVAREMMTPEERKRFDLIPPWKPPKEPLIQKMRELAPARRERELRESVAHHVRASFAPRRVTDAAALILPWRHS